MAEFKGRPGSAATAAHRRRQGRRHPEETVFPAQEGVPLLRREDRRHQLQGREDAARLRGGAGQDRSAPHLGRVRAAPAAADRRHQEGAQHRAAAVRGAVLRAGGNRHGSHSERRHRKAGQPRPGGQGGAGIRPQFPAAQAPGGGGHGVQQEDRGAGAPGAPAQGSQAEGRGARTCPSC